MLVRNEFVLAPIRGKREGNVLTAQEEAATRVDEGGQVVLRRRVDDRSLAGKQIARERGVPDDHSLRVDDRLRTCLEGRFGGRIRENVRVARRDRRQVRVQDIGRQRAARQDTPDVVPGEVGQIEAVDSGAGRIDTTVLVCFDAQNVLDSGAAVYDRCRSAKAKGFPVKEFVDIDIGEVGFGTEVDRYQIVVSPA